VNGSTSVTVQVEGVGTIQGQVLGPDGAMPQPNVVVRIFGPKSQQAFSANDGSFQFTNVRTGTYSLDSIDNNGILRARQAGLVLASGGR